MTDKTRNIVVTVTFLVLLFGLAVMCVIAYFNPDDISEAERRPLAQFPEDITLESVIDKTTIDEFEKYSVDQFPLREFFREIKAKFQMNVLGLKENNGLAVEDGYIVKIEPEFSDKATDHSLGRLQFVYDRYFKDNGGKHYISIIPDKNYFLGRDYGYPSPDYEALINKAQSKLEGVEYIDIFGELTLEDYYRTDTHWSQDKLGGVVDKLGSVMGFSDALSGSYDKHVSGGFKGVYYGQSALSPIPDTITYLTNSVINGLKVFDYSTGKEISVYDLEKLSSRDAYEVFLSGTLPLLRIDNPNAKNDKEIIIFRDSFGSSIAPLIAEGYKTVYLVDIRYIHPMQAMMTIDPANKDVLFLYSTIVLNGTNFQ